MVPGHQRRGRRVVDLPSYETTTERLRLKALDASFAPQVLDYLTRNAAYRGPWAPVPGNRFLTLEGQRDRLESARRSMAAGQQLTLWLFGREDAPMTRALGFVSLSNIVRGAFESCHLGYEIDGEVAGRGLMTEALRRLVTVAFDELGLHRIEANIIPRNARSIRVVEKLGFTYEGLSPKYLRINGVWEDHGHYVMLNEAD